MGQKVDQHMEPNLYTADKYLIGKFMFFSDEQCICQVNDGAVVTCVKI